MRPPQLIVGRPLATRCLNSAFRYCMIVRPFFFVRLAHTGGCLLVGLSNHTLQLEMSLCIAQGHILLIKHFQPFFIIEGT